MRARVDNFIMDSGLHRGAFQFEVTSFTMTGTTAVANTSNTILALDPGGAARNLDLPAADNNLNRGQWFIVVNLADSAETITVRHNGGATIMSVAQGKIGLAWQVGTAGAPQTAGWFGAALP